MSFGNILGQMLQQGLGGQAGGRLQQSLGGLGGAGSGGGGPLDGILAQVQGALAGAQRPGGIGDRARDFMTKDQVGGMSGGQIGGIGALAGAILGGGVGGAARGGMLAILGTMALSALKNANAAKAAGGAAAGRGDVIDLDPNDVQAVANPDVEKLLVRAMIAAAKADGSIDQAEMEKIIGKIGEGGVTDAEKAFVMSELSTPVDVAALAREATSPAVAAQVYAASLVSVSVDSDAERAHLRALAQALGLDAATVAQLHQMTGQPAV
ncbi:tellurite resistance TerB family protein [Amaricoccus sp.]|uniref:tellurite resistance TerB family protein n=1 Tax=Amaricoccus sp. TaxID=1872485 RepID=UPI001B55507B|nr:tellurite resistance TerB family protein [Amaricoccus sp.]MBP7240735.1 tellurite resistance TerB family protein [Amaricoccus sp.]